MDHVVLFPLFHHSLVFTDCVFYNRIYLTLLVKPVVYNCRIIWNPAPPWEFSCLSPLTKRRSFLLVNARAWELGSPAFIPSCVGDLLRDFSAPQFY